MKDRWTTQTHQTHVILFVGFLSLPITGLVTVWLLNL